MKITTVIEVDILPGTSRVFTPYQIVKFAIDTFKQVIEHWGAQAKVTSLQDDTAPSKQYAVLVFTETQAVKIIEVTPEMYARLRPHVAVLAEGNTTVCQADIDQLLDTGVDAFDLGDSINIAIN